jgi:hypothetical protein
MMQAVLLKRTISFMTRYTQHIEQGVLTPCAYSECRSTSTESCIMEYNRQGAKTPCSQECGMSIF